MSTPAPTPRPKRRLRRLRTAAVGLVSAALVVTAGAWARDEVAYRSDVREQRAYQQADIDAVRSWRGPIYTLQGATAAEYPIDDSGKALIVDVVEGEVAYTVVNLPEGAGTQCHAGRVYEKSLDAAVVTCITLSRGVVLRHLKYVNMPVGLKGTRDLYRLLVPGDARGDVEVSISGPPQIETPAWAETEARKVLRRLTVLDPNQFSLSDLMAAGVPVQRRHRPFW